MPDFLTHLFSSDRFMPHGHCYLWNPELVWLHVISDGLIALAYAVIPFTLVHLARKRKDIPFNWMFLCFGMFIVACGATHVMEIWTLWTPTYWLSGVIKAITAMASVPTAVLLIRLIPRALAIPTASELSKAHEDLRKANEALETRVKERTAELAKKNAQLEKEIGDRQHSERRFSRLVESGIIGIVISDQTGVITDANDTFLATVGYSRDEVVARTLTGQMLNVPGAENIDLPARTMLKAKGVAPPWEKEIVRRDGTRIPILIGVAMLEEATQESVAFVLDLTKARRAEAHKTAVMEAALDAIVLMDHEGNITELNGATEKTLGYSRDEVIGKRLADVLLPAALREANATNLRLYLESTGNEGAGKRIELLAARKDEREFPAEVAVVRIRGAGAPMFTVYIRDITERRQAAAVEVLRRAKEAAEEANAELETFSYSVAHDLRAPLRAINGFSTALQEDYAGKLDADGLRKLGRIRSAAERMAELIDALLALARLTRTEIRREEVDVSKLGRQVVEQLRGGDPTRDVEVVVADGLSANGDPQLIATVLENLIGNSWKFTSGKSGAKIEVGREARAGSPTYFVRDNGAGFDMSLVDKLFAPFRRLHSAEQFEGTGIGLATVQRIIRRHGGRIWAEGKENAGAVFHFTLASDGEAKRAAWMEVA